MTGELQYLIQRCRGQSVKVLPQTAWDMEKPASVTLEFNNMKDAQAFQRLLVRMERAEQRFICPQCFGRRFTTNPQPVEDERFASRENTWERECGTEMCDYTWLSLEDDKHFFEVVAVEDGQDSRFIP